MSTITEAAAEALATKRAEAEALEAQMCAALVDVARATLSRPEWAPLDAAALSVAHVDTSDYLAILTDGATALAVYDDGRVFWAVDEGGWTWKARIESLAHLGELLPSADLPETGGAA